MGKRGPQARSVAELFWAKVKKGPHCWEWTASGTAKGYGQLVVSRNGKQKRWIAHRLSWVLHHGPIPKGEGFHGTCVLHRCDNPRCVRPDHLFLGSNADNVRDMVAKGRFVSPCKRGEKSPAAKLTTGQVLAIYADPRSRAELAREYGVHYNTISLIKRREKWKTVLPTTLALT